MIEREIGQLEGLLSQGLDREPGPVVVPVVAARLPERCEIMMGRLAPDHPAACKVSPPAHRIEALLVVQQTAHRRRDGSTVAERHEHAAVPGQQLLGMPVGRRDDRIATTERITERAGGRLRFAEVGGDIDVRRADELLQLLDLHETVVEGDVRRHAQFLGKTLQAQPVGFAFRAHEVRMGCPKHEIDQIRMLPGDLGQRLNHVLDPLARGEQAEGQQHLLALDPELILEGVRIDEWRLRNAVRDQIDLGGRRTIDLAKNRAPALGHHDQPLRLPDDLVHHPPLVGSGLLQDGMQGGHHRQVDLTKDGQDVAARAAAIDSELMLQTEHVEAVETKEVHRFLIVAQALLLDLEPDFLAIIISFRQVIDGQHAAFRVRVLSGHGISQVGREGRDAAPARPIVGNERDL